MTDTRAPHPEKNKARARWCVRVTYASGYDAYLRRGHGQGGPIATFANKKTAEMNAAFVAQGFDEGDIATAVRYRKELENEY